MKVKIYFIMILAGLGLLSGCNSDDGQSTPEGLIGTWIWIESSGGFLGTETPASTGTTKTIQITDDEVKVFVNGELLNTWTYNLETHSSIFGGEKLMFVYPEDRRQSFEISGNELFLNDECYDCFSSKYISAPEE